MAHKRRSPRLPGKRSPSLRDIEKEVKESSIGQGALDSLKPGEFNDDEMSYLRHPSGVLLQLAEWQVTLEDAVNIVKAGADVYVNPGDYPFRVQGTIYRGERQWWLLGEAARELDRATALRGKMTPQSAYRCISQMRARLRFI